MMTNVSNDNYYVKNIEEDVSFVGGPKVFQGDHMMNQWSRAKKLSSCT